VTVRDEADGLRKRFTQDQLNDRGLQIFKDGRAIGISQLSRGDEITATVISQHPPVVVTEQDVQATPAQSQSKTESTPRQGGIAGRRGATHHTRCDSQAIAPPPAPAPVESSGLGTACYLPIAVAIAALLFFVVRRSKDENQSR
jgi:hypothetical protein